MTSPQTARADEFARVKVRLSALVASLDGTVERGGTSDEEFDRGAAHASAVTARQLREILNDTALGITPRPAPELLEQLRTILSDVRVVPVEARIQALHLLDADAARQPGAGEAGEQPVPLPAGIILAALEVIRQEHDPGTFAHDTAHKAIDDYHAALRANAAARQPQPAPGDVLWVTPGDGTAIGGLLSHVGIEPQPAPGLSAALAGERERIARYMDKLASNYPETVFPPSSDSRDAVGGTAMRHAYRTAARMIRAGNAGLDT